MADPVLVDHFRAQFIWQGLSGMPEDKYVNSFVFKNNGLGDPSGAIAATLDAFWRTNHATTGGAALASFVPGAVVENTPEVRVYDLGAPPPREPSIHPIAALTLSSIVPLPQEVAVCGSYYADRNLPRQRGRIYVGPLHTGVAANSANGHVAPSASFITSLTAALRFLINNGNDLGWCVLSQVDGVARPITNGWVDNAFDTQRRRGTDATSRTTFAA